ncbi:MAG: hypothetical protein IJK96_06370 [Bacteroidales bacterium]|nr:hypothetical protein [Bacteroidales bacterium]
MKRLIPAILTVLILAAVPFSCSKDKDSSAEANQEKNIAALVESILSSVEGSYVVYQDGVTRVVVTPGDPSDSLSDDGSATVYYAGYTLPGSTLSTANLFVTNYKEFAEEVSWSVSDSTVFQSVVLSPSDKNLLPGLRRGLPGVHRGEESVILFTSKYGFGGSRNGTINAHSALAYQIWVQAVNKE